MSIKELLLICESGKSQTDSINPRLIELGQTLKSKGWCDKIKILIVSENSEQKSFELSKFVDEILFAQSDEYGNYNPEAVLNIASSIITESKPRLVLLGNTFTGMDIGARIASKMKATIFSNCTDLTIDESGQLHFFRPIYRGKLIARVLTPADRTTIATIQTMNATPMPNPNPAKIQRIELASSGKPSRIRSLKLSAPEFSARDITKSDILVAGGRGIADKENFKLIEDLSTALQGAPAASRPLVDMGWVDKDLQVGMSGKTVKPKLYIACGISGAMEHLEGMKNSNTIVAINKDRNAPIFGIAHYGIVADLNEIVPELEKQAAALRKAVRG